MKIRKALCTWILIGAMVFLSAAAHAASAKTMFKYAKNTLKALATCNYDLIVESLPVSGISPDASEWENFAVRGLSLNPGISPQTKYAVAYRRDSRWRIAVPVNTPDSGNVPVLFLDSEDGSTFCGYGCNTWAETVAEYKSSDNVVWNDEYFGSAATAETDDF